MADPDADAPAHPFADPRLLFEQFKLPGVDMASIAESQRKGIEALVEANKAVQEGVQALAMKQTELFQQAVQGLQDAAKSAIGAVGDPVKQAELARLACEKAFADMKELADIASRSQADAMARITERSAQNLQDLAKMMPPRQL